MANSTSPNYMAEISLLPLFFPFFDEEELNFPFWAAESRIKIEKSIRFFMVFL